MIVVDSSVWIDYFNGVLRLRSPFDKLRTRYAQDERLWKPFPFVLSPSTSSGPA